MDGTGGALHDEKLGLDPDHAETEHEEKPGPGPDQPEGLPSSLGSATHTDEGEETAITSTKFVSPQSCKDC